MPAQNPAERAMIARLAAYERWARCEDPSAATAPARAAARKAAVDRFERQVDPDLTLPPAERARRAARARAAHFTRLSLKSAQARRQRASAAESE